MPALKFFLATVFLSWTSCAVADAYQLLRSDPAGYQKVVPEREWVFPADHLPHENFRIEWWYLTANLADESGQSYGVHWTLFRQSLNAKPNPSGWSSNQVWMGHGAISTPQGHVYHQKFARGGIGQAGVEINRQGRFDAWLDDWRLLGRDESMLPGELTFGVDKLKITLSLDMSTPWVLQGDNGYSQKSLKGQASYYYSQPHIDVSGYLKDGERDIKLSGKGWLDREWSSQPLAPDQPGWDWLSIHLDDGNALMIYRLRSTKGDDWISGSWVDPQGRSETLAAGDVVFAEIQRTDVTTRQGQTREMPLHWRVELPEKGLSWVITPQSAQHWLDTVFPYWEGPVNVTGSTNGKGYLELTGY